MMTTKDRILQFIRDYHDEHQWAPSVREIGRAVGLLSTSTVQYHLAELAQQGRIVYKGVRQVRVVR
ncbi:MAG: hypothetical protein M0021_09945 [Clostridia bacterium]|nr:hypothetical protein [Clostridia bacterium]